MVTRIVILTAEYGEIQVLYHSKIAYDEYLSNWPGK